MLDPNLGCTGPPGRRGGVQPGRKMWRGQGGRPALAKVLIRSDVWGWEESAYPHFLIQNQAFVPVRFHLLALALFHDEC